MASSSSSSSPPNTLCIWDAFGEYSCKRTGSASPPASSVNPFARPNPKKPQWEMFAQPRKETFKGAGPFDERFSAQGDDDDNEVGVKPVEKFCGCQAVV